MLIYVLSSFIHNKQRLKKTKKWIKKMWYLIIKEYYSNIKNNGTIKYVDKSMNLEKIILMGGGGTYLYSQHSGRQGQVDF